MQFAPKWAQAHRPNVLHLSSGTVVVPLPPGHNADFAAYATAFMRRYGAHGSFWATHRSLPNLPVSTVEVWNEPDNTHNWGPQINLHDYANMYEAVRSAVHRVNRHARVMTGGLAWTRSSLPRLLKAFAGKPMDALAIHPYAANAARDDRAYPLGARRNAPVRARIHTLDRQRVRLDLDARHLGIDPTRHVKPYAYQALIGLSKLRLAQVLPFEWASASWGLNDGPYARALARITHHR